MVVVMFGDDGGGWLGMRKEKEEAASQRQKQRQSGKRQRQRLTVMPKRKDNPPMHLPVNHQSPPPGHHLPGQLNTDGRRRRIPAEVPRLTTAVDPETRYPVDAGQLAGTGIEGPCRGTSKDGLG